MYNNDYLKHYGILGMRWGRKGVANAVPTRSSEDHNKKMELKKKKLHEMTNDEIRAYTQRMALEKQYKELSKNDLSAGRKFVNKMIGSMTKVATDKALDLANKQAGKLVDELLKKTMKQTTDAATDAVKDAVKNAAAEATKKAAKKTARNAASKATGLMIRTRLY